MTEAAAGVTYTQALAKGGALLGETRALLLAWEPGEPPGRLADRVLQKDVLGRATAHRVRDLVRVFARRLLTPTDTPARHVRRLAGDEAPHGVFRDLVFYYAALADDLLRDFTVDIYWPGVRDGQLIITNKQVQHLIWEAEQDGRIPTPWSAEIKRDMAGRVLITLTDFGLLRELKPAQREVVPYRAADGTVVYLAHLLRSRGVTDAALASQPDWALCGLQPREVWHRLESLAGEGWFVIQRAGEVARITWRHATVEEAVDALAR